MRTIASLAAAVLFAAAPLSEAPAQDVYDPGYAPQAQLFSAQELDNLLAPVALYPDPILAQLLIAATFPDQIELANRYVRYYGTARVDEQAWDISVRSVAHYPSLLTMMAERDDWTTAVGQAYAIQSGDVMASVQQLRRLARQQGNLLSTPEHDVMIDRDYIRIVPVQPRVIYIPVYDPLVIYHRPVFQIGFRTSYWSFGIGFPIGSWLTYDCDWYGRRVYYDGWRGGGWRARSRPHIQIVNIYINPRYEVVHINQTVIHRQVNYGRLGGFNSIHRGTTFENAERNAPRVVQSIPRPPERYAVPRQQTAAERRLDPDANGRSVQPRDRTVPQNPAPVIERRATVPQTSQRSAASRTMPTPRDIPSQPRVVTPPRDMQRQAQSRVVPTQPRVVPTQPRVMPQPRSPVVERIPQPQQQVRPNPAPERVIRNQPPAAQQRVPASRATPPPQQSQQQVIPPRSAQQRTLPPPS